MNIVEKAKMIAITAHRAVGHKRKYTGECYTGHLREVASYVEAVGGTQEQIAAAWLHDIIEDTKISHGELITLVGFEIADMVYWLSDQSRPEDGNRALRKSIDREHSRQSPPDVQTIKYADILSNTASIVEFDANFCKVYIPEMQLLLALIPDGNPILKKRADIIVSRAVMALSALDAQKKKKPTVH